jgi:hypothetical protein
VIARLDPLLPPMAEPIGPEDLRSLVEGLAGSPGLWASRVRHDSGSRIFELLWTDPRVDVWLICWSGEDHDSVYGVADDGTLRREAVGATHELRAQGRPA